MPGNRARLRGLFAALGLSASEFPEVIEMLPHGAVFADPVVVRRENKSTLMLHFASAAPTAPELLLPNAAGDGLELRHFSYLLPFPTIACTTLTDWAMSPHCPSLLIDSFVEMSCKSADGCIDLDVSCCVPAGTGVCTSYSDKIRHVPHPIENPSCSGAGGGSGSGVGIWATDSHGDVQLITRTGDLLEVVPGDFRTVAGLQFNAGDYSIGNSEGRPSAFNNLGQLAFAATFTDGTSGIFVSNRVAIPEPGSLLLALIAPAIVFARKRDEGNTNCCTSRPARQIA